MTIEKTKEGTDLTVKLTGWLNTATSPEFSKFIEKELDGITSLTLDFSELEYVSSAGLRVILCTKKAMKNKGDMIIMHANDEIKEMFDFTGFARILTLVD